MNLVTDEVAAQRNKRMKLSRIIIGIQFMLLSSLILKLFQQVREDILWSALGKWYRDSSNVADVDFPVVVRMLMPFAPVAWWSWITPVAVGIFVATRLRRSLDSTTLILSSLGTVAFCVVMISVFLAYSMPFQYMGYPQEVPVDPSSMVANLALVALSVGCASYAISRGRAV